MTVLYQQNIEFPELNFYLRIVFIFYLSVALPNAATLSEPGSYFTVLFQTAKQSFMKMPNGKF